MNQSGSSSSNNKWNIAVIADPLADGHGFLLFQWFCYLFGFITRKCPAPPTLACASFWISRTSVLQNWPKWWDSSIQAVISPGPAGHSASGALHNFPAWHQSVQLRPWGAWRRWCPESWKSWPEDWSWLVNGLSMLFPWYLPKKKKCLKSFNHQNPAAIRMVLPSWSAI